MSNPVLQPKLPQEVNNNRAFTLIEVMLVMLILTCMTTIALPYATNSLAHYQTITTVHKLVSDIQYTQQLALRSEDTMATYQIIFYPETERYSIRHGLNSIREEHFPTWVELQGTNLPLDDNREVLAFNLQGNPLQGGTITITNGRTGKQFDVIITMLTGRVRVETN